MKKSNFKKMALMGMAGGLLMAAQAPAAVTGNAKDKLAGGGCGGKGGGCGGYRPNNPQVERHGCGGGSPTRQSQNYTASCHNKSGCGGSQAYAPRQSQYYTADADADEQMYPSSSMQSNQTSGRMMTESELMNQLTPENKALFQTLDAEGKAMALKLASETYTDKNQAVKMAAQKMADKRKMMNKMGTNQGQPQTYNQQQRPQYQSNY